MAQNYSDLLEKSLDESRLELLHLLAYQAVMLEMPLYLVGGVVRDVLLGYPIREFDLVIEGDSAEFAEFIVKKYGGRVMIHPKFGTATWVLNDSTLKRLNFPAFELSDFSLSFDLISARSETYSSPGVLPTVTRSTIDDDLRRRDFTINAMAIRLDGHYFGELLDPLGGQKDLDGKLIRVLHDKSFMDDPTRIFRAVRYAVRYGFELAFVTRQLVNTESLDVLAQLSGERIRHEFDLIFEETNPVGMLKMLKGLDVLATVHPALQTADSGQLITLKRNPDEMFGEFAISEIFSFRQTLGWILYLVSIPEDQITSIADRLAFPALLNRSVRAASSLLRDLPSFRDWKPSQWTFHLDELPSLAIYGAWLLFPEEEALSEYLTKWQNVKPFTNGDVMKKLGLEPGPRYKEILTRLRAAWLDGEVKSEDEEFAFRDRLIAE